MQLDVYAFIAISAVTVATALYVFLAKKIMHAVAALASVFTGSAVVFLILGQTLVALLQMLVFVGGLSTYLVVAVASEERKAMLIRLPYFAAAMVLILITLLMLMGSAPTGAVGEDHGASFLSSASSAFQSQYAVFYIIAALLFGTVISGVFVIKKFSRLLV
jgi:NADH:ubiquinone oxidoreductase subunit 6 (subunit J)